MLSYAFCYSITGKWILHGCFSLLNCCPVAALWQTKHLKKGFLKLICASTDSPTDTLKISPSLSYGAFMWAVKKTKQNLVFGWFGKQQTADSRQQTADSRHNWPAISLSTNTRRRQVGYIFCTKEKLMSRTCWDNLQIFCADSDQHICRRSFT